MGYLTQSLNTHTHTHTRSSEVTRLSACDESPGRIGLYWVHWSSALQAQKSQLAQELSSTGSHSTVLTMQITDKESSV